MPLNKKNNKENSNFINVPEEVLIELKSSFDLFDTDQSGCIDTKCTYLIKIERIEASNDSIGVWNT